MNPSMVGKAGIGKRKAVLYTLFAIGIGGAATSLAVGLRSMRPVQAVEAVRVSPQSHLLAPTPPVPTDAALPETPAPSQVPATQEKDRYSSTNCYDNDTLQLAFGEKATSDMRTEFAVKAASALEEKGIQVVVAGEDRKYLLFTASSENTESLKAWASSFKRNGSDRANMCLKGFAEAQFIIRNDNMDQKLLMKIPTDIGQAADYIQRKYGATPME